MHDAVELPAGLIDALRELRVVIEARAGEIHRIDGGGRAPILDDSVVGGLQLAHGSAEQDDLGPAPRGAERDAASESAPRTGDEHGTAREGVGRR